ncbi:MAG: hypothetical protein A2Y38_21425 [Spirochaetes bacterium GWB1_59_5]|nr:MAG: hypothetical protein A2Y38_21425 [Spirochaetes bacterium GWB1_59_5]
MSDEYLSFEDGEMHVGMLIIPGILVSLRVNGSVRFDQSESDQMSGKNKIPHGWEDADIQVSMDLLCDDKGDCYDKLNVISLLFKGADKGANPQIFRVTNRHMWARRIDKVVFSGLESNEDDQSDVIRISMTFTEHLPAVVKREKQGAATKIASGTPAPAVKAKPVASTAIVTDTTNPILAGFNAGNN